MDRENEETKQTSKSVYMLRRAVFIIIMLGLLTLLAVGIVRLIKSFATEEVPYNDGLVYGACGYEADWSRPEAEQLLTESGRAQVERGATVKMATDLSNVTFNVPGTYEVSVYFTGTDGVTKTYVSKITVKDTTPPVGTPVDVTLNIGEKADVLLFVRDVVDVTDVSLSFVKAPDTKKAGQQSVTLKLRDKGGNETLLNSILTVIDPSSGATPVPQVTPEPTPTPYVDDVPPVIEGAQDINVYVGDSVSYKKGVTVTDNSGEEPELVIDNSQVKLNEIGRYPVFYSATDSTGNKTTVTVYVTVEEKPDDNKYSEATVKRRAAKIVDEIITPGMSETEKCVAIYKYVRNHMGYKESKDMDDVNKAAFIAMTDGIGDCYIYYSLTKVILDAAGLENQMVYIERANGTHHYWCLVHISSGWYHFDTVPRKAGGDFCLLTDAEILAYSKKHSSSHAFDQSKYPATPEKSLGINPWA